MPVIRKPIQINDTRSIQPVRMPDNPMIGVLERTTRDVIDQSRTMGRMLAEQAQTYAEGLVREAEFSVNDKGVPELPPNVTKNMGRIARQTYDSGIADRMTYEIGTAVGAELDLMATQYEDDTDAYAEAAEGYRQQFSDELPKEFQGAFGTIFRDKLSQSNALVARKQKQLENRVATETIDTMVGSWVSDLQTKITQYDTSNPSQVSNLLMGYINGVMDQHDRHGGPLVKKQRIDRLIKTYGRELLFKELDVANMSIGQLADLKETLIDPQERAVLLAEYVPFFSVGKDQNLNAGTLTLPIPEGMMEKWQQLPDGVNAKTNVYDFDIGKDIASELNIFMTQARANEQEKAKLQELNGFIENIANGHAEDNPNHRFAFNHVVGQQLGIPVDEVNSSLFLGTSIQHPDIFNSETADGTRNRNAIITQAKQAGIMPQALRQAFMTMQNNPTVENVKTMYAWLLDLRDAPASEGIEGLPMHDILPERTMHLMDTVESYVGTGNTFDEPLEKAIQMSQAILNNELSDDEYKLQLDKFMPNADVADLARSSGIAPLTMQTISAAPASSVALAIMGVGKVNAPRWEDLDKNEKIDVKVAEWISSYLFSDDMAEVLPEHAMEAAKYFRNSLLMQSTVSNVVEDPVKRALLSTRQAIDNKYTISEFGDENIRTPFAIETVYPEPALRSVLPTMARAAKQELFAPILKDLEDIISPDMFWLPDKVNDAFRIHLGSDKVGATIVDVLVDQAIKQKLAEDDVGMALPKVGDGIGEGLYSPRMHYELRYNKTSGSNPTYNVWILGDHTENNQPVELIRGLDISQGYRQITGELNNWKEAAFNAKVREDITQSLPFDELSYWSKFILSQQFRQYVYDEQDKYIEYRRKEKKAGIEAEIGELLDE